MNTEKKRGEEPPKQTVKKALHTEKNGQGNSATVGGRSEEEIPSLEEIIREQATEEELPLSKNFTLRKILGGDILTTSTIRKQVWLFMLITFFMIIYISNRYSCQQDLIEIDNLQKELQDIKYRALSSNSQLTEKSRESHVLELLKSNKDSVLKIANQPPYIINVPDNE